jgi:hypothetical protein
MDATTTITIGGVRRQIVSYENLLIKEPGNIELGVRSLSPFQYNSMLFANLGYSKCPKDMLWLEKEIPIEQVPKTEVLDYPITHNKLMIINKTPSLFDLLHVIRNWIKDGYEKGHLMDPQKACQLPSMEEMQYNYANQIKIMKSNNVKSKIDMWDKADIFYRRWFNLNPTIDPEYFEFSLSNNFEQASKLVNVYDPYAVFVSVLIDPDILMSAIRQAEKEAAHIVFNTNTSIPVCLINIREVTKEFNKIMQIKFKQISNIFRSRGAEGFVDKRKEALRNKIHVVPRELKCIVPYPDDILMQNINIAYNWMANTPLDGEHISNVRSYVEPGTLKFIDNLGEDSEVRRMTYKRLYYTIENQFKTQLKEEVSTKDKFILSEGFFINPQCFALYKKSSNKFYICDIYFYVHQATPQEAVAFYADYFGKQVLLNPNEIGEQIEADRCPDIDLTELEIQATGMYGQIPIQIVQQPQPIQQQPQVPTNDMTPIYGMPVSNLVEGI